MPAFTSSDKTALDAASHTTAVIVGAGVSGLDALIQLKRLLKLDDVACYEKDGELGGTWAANRYPGASCDIPIAFYSFSFEPATEFSTQWPGAEGICRYYERVVNKYRVRPQIVFHTVVDEARFSRSTGLWTVQLRNVVTGETRTKTCNILVSAVGALSTPADAPFDTSEFDGAVMHSARWNKDVSLKDKDVVVLGNGCSAAQLVPAILPEVKSLTQIGRGKHAIVPPNAIVDNAFTNGLYRWLPGLFTFFRWAVYQICESYFYLADKDQGAEGRKSIHEASTKYIEKTAPAKYRDQLVFDFEFGQKCRIIDFSGYCPSLHSPKFNLLLPDTIVSAKGRTVTTEKGVEVPADVIVLSTGFKVTEYLHPLSVFNSEGESLVERLKGNGVKTYLTSMVASYPNFWLLMGPNAITGHSSALFNTECTVDMMVHLLKPVVKQLKARSISSEGPAPSVEVIQQAEDEWYAKMRAQMAKMVWEMDGGISWYVDPSIGKCTILFPWSQPEFLRQTREMPKERFVWAACA
ncbi:uncharacterized protein RHOBADRAFT_54566 [Rhodotorula graminis WP1]|uniref:Uncharacterized protein n=1 Tax=Rhodotorula graminis (strain WP1) TaxID=578459 RepID=A0A0P9GKR5_RHOGW|nr:uncharacterized protein RHOBADRAFT_54566 [Rhodotorula graminis WP1]KPV73988.1 hypothetical protein RHOBADRAFT_54566 [Rhodotorula graminis WP1]